MPGFGTKRVREVAAQSITKWSIGPASPSICRHETHIWRIDLSTSPQMDCDAIISAEEIERANRFRFEKDRRRFKIAHASLRLILSRYLKLAPAELVFAQTDYGKPFLVNSEADGLLFNMSHSGDVVLIAVAREREVGVDVEFMRPDFATMEVAEQFFSIAEIYTLSGLPEHLRTSAFFNCWTSKEAYVKARGEGLSIPLDQFDVSLGPGVPAAMLGNRIDEPEMSRWNFQTLEIDPRHAGALVIESLESLPLVHCFEFCA